MLPKIKHNWLVELGLESLASLTSAWILSDGALMALCSLSKSLEASEIFQRHMDVKGWNVKGQIKCLFSSSAHPSWLGLEDLPYPTKDFERRC